MDGMSAMKKKEKKRKDKVGCAGRERSEAGRKKETKEREGKER